MHSKNVMEKIKNYESSNTEKPVTMILNYIDNCVEDTISQGKSFDGFFPMKISGELFDKIVKCNARFNLISKRLEDNGYSISYDGKTYIVDIMDSNNGDDDIDGWDE